MDYNGIRLADPGDDDCKLADYGIGSKATVRFVRRKFDKKPRKLVAPSGFHRRPR